MYFKFSDLNTFKYLSEIFWNSRKGRVSKPEKTSETLGIQFSAHCIVFVWSQYDGTNIEQQKIGYGWRQKQKAKLKIVGGALSQTNKSTIQHL